MFGLALDAFEDKVKVSRASSDGEGRISIKNSDQAIPSTPESNSAGLVKKMMQDFGISYNTEIEAIKGVPSGYGVGSSAASSSCHGI